MKPKDLVYYGMGTIMKYGGLVVGIGSMIKIESPENPILGLGVVIGGGAYLAGELINKTTKGINSLEKDLKEQSFQINLMSYLENKFKEKDTKNEKSN